MNKKNYPALLLGALGLTVVAASPAFAADSGWYVGGSVGQANTNVDTGAIDAAVRGAGAATSSTTADDSDTGWKLFFGYQFNQNFALELNYTDLGNISTTTTTTGPVGTVSGRFDSKGWGIDGIAMAPISKEFDLFAKIGFFRWEADATAAAIVGGAAAAVARSDSGTSAKFGLGARYHFTENVALRLEWERFNDIGNESTTGNGSFNLFSLGLQVKF
jgi:OmpA-OmpF porin, OOP family